MARVIMIVIMAAAGPVVMPVIVDFFARGLFLRQQGGLETELAQRVLDFFDRCFALGEREIQPFACNGHFDIGNAGQARKRGFDLGCTAAAIHAANRKDQGIVLLDAGCCLGRVVTAAR